MSIDLSGLNKAEVLAALYNGSHPQGMGFLHFDPTPMTVNEAQALLDAGQTYFDYLKGRVMKVDLKSDLLEPWGYDQDNYPGAAAKVISVLRKSGNTNADQIKSAHSAGTAKAIEITEGMMSEKSTMKSDGLTAYMTLGLADVADILKPKVDQAKGQEVE